MMFVTLCFMVLLGLAVFINGFVLQFMWGWFLMPLGLASISLFQAIGIFLILELVCGRYTDIYTIRDNPNPTIIISYLFYRPLAIMIVGYLLSLAL